MLNKLFGPKPTDHPPVFAVGTGRCGTHLLESLMAAVKGMDANHIQDLEGDSFYRYAAWNEIPVDLEGFFAPRDAWVSEAQKKGKVYFESNPYLSFHLEALAERYDAKFIFIYRNPEKVVKSHVVKGWYETLPAYADANKIVGFQYDMKPNHFFGRILPRGKEAYEAWHQMTRIGKISWMYDTVNLRVHEQAQRISDRVFYLKVEELDYAKFGEMLDFLDLSGAMSEKKFNEIAASRPGKSGRSTEATWSEQEQADFRRQVAESAKALGYELG